MKILTRIINLKIDEMQELDQLVIFFNNMFLIQNFKEK